MEQQSLSDLLNANQPCWICLAPREDGSCAIYMEQRSFDVTTGASTPNAGLSFNSTSFHLFYLQVASIEQTLSQAASGDATAHANQTLGAAAGENVDGKTEKRRKKM